MSYVYLIRFVFDDFSEWCSGAFKFYLVGYIVCWLAVDVTRGTTGNDLVQKQARSQVQTGLTQFNTLQVWSASLLRRKLHL